MTQKILLALTTYAGDFKQRLILRKVVRHLRAKNKDDVFLLIVSDGKIKDQVVHTEADHLIERTGPSGLHQGELDSMWVIAHFAKEHHFPYVIKSAGDIIMTKPYWARAVLNRFLETNAKILSTHWFYDNSWIIGTKFFVAQTDFLLETLPDSTEGENLEKAFTQSISKAYSIQDVAYLINTTTGERDEVTNELKDWGWEYTHRLSKFIYLDEYALPMMRWIFKAIFYPVLQIISEALRGIKKIKKK
jgi:hypothetical protein